MLILGVEIPADVKIEVEVKGPLFVHEDDYKEAKALAKNLPLVKTVECRIPCSFDIDLWVTNRLDNCDVTVDGIKVTKGDFRQRFLQMLAAFDNVSYIDVHTAIDTITHGSPVPGTYYVDIHNDVDWYPGAFHESDQSCWWTNSDYTRGRSQFRWMCRKREAFALRYYTQYHHDKESHWHGGGRCFVAKFEENDQECWAVFNAYGPNEETFAIILTTMLKMPAFVYRSVDLNDSMYINDTYCPIISKRPDKLTFEHHYDDCWSDYSYDSDIADGEEEYLEHECDGWTCENCGQCDDDWGISVHETYGGEYYCDSCLNNMGYIYVEYNDNWIRESQVTSIDVEGDGEVMMHQDSVSDFYCCPDCNEVWGSHWTFVCEGCQEIRDEAEVEETTESV